MRTLMLPHHDIYSSFLSHRLSNRYLEKRCKYIWINCQLMDCTLKLTRSICVKGTLWGIYLNNTAISLMQNICLPLYISLLTNCNLYLFNKCCQELTWSNYCMQYRTSLVIALNIVYLILYITLYFNTKYKYITHLYNII